MNSVGSNNLSLKYQRLTPSGCKDIGIRKFDFIATTQFPLTLYSYLRSNKAFKGTDLYRAQLSLHGGSLEITLTVPLSRA